MKKTIVIMASALSLLSLQALADDHRGGDAALGALSGAVVLGPIGAVAGAVVGYTAGPSIAHSWGFRRSSAARHARKPTRQEAQLPPAGDHSAPNNRVAASTVASPAAQAPTPAQAPAAASAARTASTAPPVQGLE
jgi:predicted lipid-binding transport protein (Tim44 family)